MTTAPKKKFSQAVEDAMPQVTIPGERDEWKKMEDYSDGFILTIAITLLGVAAFGLIWLITK